MARYYALPSVSTRDAFYSDAAAGTLDLAEWLLPNDGTHPPPAQQVVAPSASSPGYFPAACLISYSSLPIRSLGPSPDPRLTLA